MSPVRTAPFPDPKLPDPKPQPCPSAEQTALAEQLHRRLLALDYPEFAGCICQLLEALGYEQARLAGRRLWKGYNRHGGGGYDLEAVLPGGLAPRRIIAQIKQFEHLTVHQRSVDELRGACLRTGAAEGLLVTTSTFSEVLRRRAAPPSFATPNLYGGLAAPVRLIDGQELLGLLIRHRIGVREYSGIRKSVGVREYSGVWQHCLVGRHLTLDEAFFATLSSVGSDGVKRDRAKGNHSPSLPRWRMIVRIFPVRIFSTSLFPGYIFQDDGPGARRGRRTSGDSDRKGSKQKDSNSNKKDSNKKGGR